MRLKPRQLEAFRHVMLAHGVTAAADAMNITQPAVSRLIRDLEMAIGMTLFNRQGARLRPTPEADLLFHEVERLYIGIDQVARAANDIRQHKNVVLRIGSVSSLVRPFLHQALIDITGEQHDLPLVLDVENSRHIWDMVENNHYDLGFVFGPPRPGDMQTVRLCNSQAVAVMRRDHPLVECEIITPSDLANYRVLTAGRNSPLRRGLDLAFAAAETAPLNMMETSMLNCCHFAAAGMGVGIVDHITMRAAGVSLCAKPFLPQIDVSYYAVRPAGGRTIHVLDEIVARMQNLLSG
ncbi:LysR family transcriptional regulator [Pelagibacterium sediminicola]|uniref:LysR family transcriptional regulator n=1 Tax=Pelagibacterium sediminicola TaxID=2248761 RepID=UPI000E3111F9|nr:LysR family transcriptional regulator [Pelagibacterium sediminicola]